ncbi:MAG TPA: hypothetical protein VMS65_09355 [Polyangiaceae bacterium]|nr:hypothetical protein [Polyangiaceae bacterium]
MKLGSVLAACTVGTIVSAGTLVAAQPSGSGAPGTASAPPAPASASGRPGRSDEASCVEHVPAGKARPRVVEEVPSRGQSGHALRVRLVVEHGKGETLLPSGFQAQAESSELRALENAGLYLPDPDGGAGPLLERKESGDRATTTFDISFVPLPKKPGRSVIVVPPFPISIARASGDVIVVCTHRHEVSIEDPIANVPNPAPKPNPPPRPQREVWTMLKNAVIIGAIALAVGALIAVLVTLWLRRPRPAPPPPPARPPWEVAFEELYDLRHAGLVAEARFAEHFDRVSDIVRKYLGERFGFDGLESTTREVLFVLRRLTPPLESLDSIEGFLRQADLVKFAKTEPSAEDCELALTRAERIISTTLPETKGLPAVALRPEPGALG